MLFFTRIDPALCPASSALIRTLVPQSAIGRESTAAEIPTTIDRDMLMRAQLASGITAMCNIGQSSAFMAKERVSMVYHDVDTGLRHAHVEIFSPGIR
ncbi:MAG: hypothetical protein HKO86_07595 [Gammaproteobacteria bacterium]|nr:hypothetical protein [Gammaproteobacteria bacterium]